MSLLRILLDFLRRESDGRYSGRVFTTNNIIYLLYEVAYWVAYFNFFRQIIQA